MPSKIRNHFPTRIKFCCAQTRPFGDQEYAKFLRKWSDLSEYVREIKQTFSRYFNKRHNRRGFFRGERFKSLIVEEGLTLVNLLVYIDLNPIRAGIVKRPEDYRWCSLGHHVPAGNKGNLLSMDFGIKEWNELETRKIVSKYREFVYETGAALDGLKNDTGTRRHGDAGIGEADCSGRMDGWLVGWTDREDRKKRD